MTGAKSRYHHGDLRRALLEATLELVAQKGGRGFSLNEAARLAGVSSAAPYRHFADKQALLDELAAESFAALRAALEAAADQVAPTVGRADEVVALVRAYVRFALASPARYEVMFGAGRLRDGGATSEQGRAAFGVLEAAMERGISEGAFVAGSAGELAASVWALVHGVCELALDGVFAPVAGTGESAEETALRSMRALLVGLAR
jgi:AcrR family transcriptional regulator